MVAKAAWGGKGGKGAKGRGKGKDKGKAKGKKKGKPRDGSVAPQMAAVKFCRHHLKGTCTKGDACLWPHYEKDVVDKMKKEEQRRFDSRLAEYKKEKENAAAAAQGS